MLTVINFISALGSLRVINFANENRFPSLGLAQVYPLEVL